MNGQLKSDFKARLAESHRVMDYPFWYELYQQFFPNMISMQTYKEYGFWQKQDIDKGIILNTSKQILIEEKVRYSNQHTGRVYDDIMLEYWANYKQREQGWVCKPLMADYIAYVILPLGVFYLLPVTQLQSAWGRHGKQWVAENQVITARNSGYTSQSEGVRPRNIVSSNRRSAERRI